MTIIICSTKFSAQKVNKGYICFGIDTYSVHPNSCSNFNFMINNPSFPYKENIQLSPMQIYGFSVSSGEIKMEKNFGYRIISLSIAGLFSTINVLKLSSDFFYEIHSPRIKIIHPKYQNDLKNYFSTSQNFDYKHHPIKIRFGSSLFISQNQYISKKFSSSTSNDFIINNIDLSNTIYTNINAWSIGVSPYISVTKYFQNSKRSLNAIRLILSYNQGLINWQRIQFFSHDFYSSKYTHRGETTRTTTKNYLFDNSYNPVTFNVTSPILFRIEFEFGLK